MKAAIIGCAALGVTFPLYAAEYGSDVAVRSADELVALAASGEIDDEALSELLQLYEAPIDPTQARPEELALLPGVARSEARTPGALTLSEQTAAYARYALAGASRLDSGGVYRDGDAPEAYLRLNIAPTRWLTAGASVLTRERTRVDANLRSDGPQREVGLERWHLTGTFGDVRIVVGNYTCAFGENVTFSVARRPYAPGLVAAADIVVARCGRLLLCGVRRFVWSMREVSLSRPKRSCRIATSISISTNGRAAVIPLRSTTATYERRRFLERLVSFWAE